MEKIKILFLAANPDSTERLTLDEEIRTIERKISEAGSRDAFELIFKLAVRPDDLLQALNEHRPHIVHFSGHGSKENEILLAGEDGEQRPVSAGRLKRLFSALKDNIRLVVFNACYAEGQARAVVEVIDCAVGMRERIGDDSAIAFASSFYRALGYGRSVKEAFEQGSISIEIEDLGEEDIPQLLARDQVDPAKVVLVQPDPPTNARGQNTGANRSISVKGNTNGGVFITGEGNVVGNAAAPQAGAPVDLSAAAGVWRERIAFLELELGKSADPEQRFAIQKKINDAREKLDELT